MYVHYEFNYVKRQFSTKKRQVYFPFTKKKEFKKEKLVCFLLNFNKT